MHWAFNLSRGEEIKGKWDLIPADTDVLITHEPPHGFLDLVPCDRAEAYADTGCEELLLAVKRVRPRLLVLGYFHEGYGVARESEITFVNACVCDASSRPVNQAVVIADVI